ncbi:hypothetical protein ACWDYJ_03505 [Streptomyces sp. NPDC003042]
MARNPRTARRLVVDGNTYMWSVRHAHRALGTGRGYEDCRETLTLYPAGARGSLRTVFRAGPGRLVPDGYPMHSGEVCKAEGGSLNLHEPGTVRALLEEAQARGWRPDGPATEEVDGWALFDAAARTRAIGGHL